MLNINNETAYLNENQTLQKFQTFINSFNEKFSLNFFIALINLLPIRSDEICGK